MAYVFLVALVLIFVGEIADKSQLLALVLATRYRAWQVLVGIFAATFVVHFFTALAGQLIGTALPAGPLAWISGLLFVGFGLWTLRGDSISDADADRAPRRFGPIVATAVAFFFAELGDKTQIMTLTIAADPASALLTYLRQGGPALQDLLAPLGAVGAVSPVARFWAVTLGSTLGMVLADAAAILAGHLLGKKLPETLLRRISAAVFIVFGLLTIGSTFI